LIFLHLFCFTSMKSNIIFIILFEIFVFFSLSYILCWFRVHNTLLLCLFHHSLISDCIFRNLNCKGLVCYWFYFYFILTESNRQRNRLNRKLEPVKIDIYSMDGLSLIFYSSIWLGWLLWTRICSNPPIVYPLLPKIKAFDTYYQK
jgi:hypothetical protein